MLELIEKNLKSGCLVPLDQVKSVFESRVTKPDDLPDIQTILTVNSIIKNINYQDGGQTPVLNLEHTILYVSTDNDNTVLSFTTESEHTLDLNSPNNSYETQLILNAFIEHIDFTFEDNKAIVLRSVVRAEPRLFYTQEMPIISNISGLDDLQLKHEIIPMSGLQLLPEVISELHEELVLPTSKQALGKILYNDVRVSDITVATEDGVAIVKGFLSIYTLYISQDGGQTPVLWENRIPFSSNLLLPAIDAFLVYKNCKITDFTTEIKEDDDGEPRIMSINSLISVTAICSETCETEVITDAFSLKHNLNFTTTPIKTSQIISSPSGQFVLKDIAQKPTDAPAMSEIINITGTVGHTDAQISDGKISIDGFIACKVLYLTQDSSQPVAAFDIEIPFNQHIDEPNAEPGLASALQMEIIHVSFCIISPEELELRLALHISGTLSRTEEYIVITGATECTQSEKNIIDKPSILIYVVQPGDTLWEIAKYYSTSPTELQNLNNIKNPENLIPGQKLIIA